MSILDEVKQIKEAHKSAILALPNVVGVGIGYKDIAGRITGELSIKVLVHQKLPPAGLTAEQTAPRAFDGVQTDVVQVGDIRPLQADPGSSGTPTDRWRPAPGGVSIGHYQITAGTLGCVVRDRSTSVRLILSNNHVLANSNQGSAGDPILQPGSADGGQVDRDTIARLERFCPIQFATEPPTCNTAIGFANTVNWLVRLFGASHQVQAVRKNLQAANLVDAAVARPVDDADILDEILEIGTPTGTLSATLGMQVRKSGRTTGLTHDQINILDATVSVSYGAGLSATFEDQLVTGPMSKGGDSGSLLLAEDSLDAVGLLFAGSDQSTIHNPIQAVLDCLQVQIAANPVKKNVDTQAAIQQAQQVKAVYQDQLLSKPNVVGVGVGLKHIAGRRTDEIALVVMVKEKLPQERLSPEDMLPLEIDGVPIDVKEVGDIRAQ